MDFISTNSVSIHKIYRITNVYFFLWIRKKCNSIFDFFIYIKLYCWIFVKLVKKLCLIFCIYDYNNIQYAILSNNITRIYKKMQTCVLLYIIFSVLWRMMRNYIINSSFMYTVYYMVLYFWNFILKLNYTLLLFYGIWCSAVIIIIYIKANLSIQLKSDQTLCLCQFA